MKHITAAISILALALVAGCSTSPAKLATTQISLDQQGVFHLTSPKDIGIGELSVTDTNRGLAIHLTGYQSSVDAGALQANQQLATGWQQILGQQFQFFNQVGASAARAYGIPVPPIPINNPPLFIPIPPPAVTSTNK